MNRIITFGSCLSRYVARSYKRLYAGDIVSSIYHNRSDYFVDCFLEKTKKPIDEKFISGMNLSNNKEESINILNNQTITGCGKHLLDTNKNIFEIVDSKDFDLVFIDNFMDVSSKLCSFNEYEFFIRPKDLDGDNIPMGKYINHEESARNFKKIINYFHIKNPTQK